MSEDDRERNKNKRTGARKYNQRRNGVLTRLYDVGKSVFDPLDGADSVPHLAGNYHLAALQDGAVVRPNSEILSTVACNRKIKVMSVRESHSAGLIKLACSSPRVTLCGKKSFTLLDFTHSVDYPVACTALD